jgi:ElaB/YqjD/DUF883 family membrane-anchored ribosome-binding protein
MGSKTSKENTDTKWNNMKTDDISSYIPHLNSLSKDAKKLISNLTIPTFTDTQSSEFNIDKFMNDINSKLGTTDKKVFNKIIDEMSSEVSATSPFISSDVYQNMLNSTTSTDQPAVQAGGKGKRQINKSKGKHMRGGMDDSDTSSTDSDLDDMTDSSDSDLDSSSDKKKKKNKHRSKHTETETQSAGSNLSYISSSAHTDSNKSITDENGLQSTSISVNTEDINMVSEY